MNLHEDKLAFLNIINLVHEDSGIRSDILEKDYYVTLLLRELAGKLNCTPFVRQYGILSNKWGVLLCQREYRTNDTQRNSRSW